MMADATRYRLAQEALKDPSRLGPVPPVQRPGAALAKSENDDAVTDAVTSRYAPNSRPVIKNRPLDMGDLANAIRLLNDRELDANETAIASCFPPPPELSPEAQKLVIPFLRYWKRSMCGRCRQSRSPSPLLCAISKIGVCPGR
jgi:hypothetical protein